jgi:hypothetical protein
MNAIKCDRCGTLEVPMNWYKMVAPALLRSPVVREMFYPREIELCDACGEELRGILREWMRAKADSRGTMYGFPLRNGHSEDDG